MAFRVAIDLGIHLPPERLRGYARNLTAEDIEIRKRLFGVATHGTRLSASI
jgi:hypothetical protein